MITIDLSPSQYRVLRTVNSDSAFEGTVEGTVSSAARASRMAQSQATSQAKAKPTAKLTLPDTHPIYGIVNLALLTVTIYLLWANL